MSQERKKNLTPSEERPAEKLLLYREKRVVQMKVADANFDSFQAKFGHKIEAN